MFSHEVFVSQQSGHDMTWRLVRDWEHEHNMSPLIIKNKTLFTREKLAFISLVSEYHLKDDVLWRLLGGHEFLFNKPVPISGRSREGARGARVPTLFLDQTEARKAEKNYFETTPLMQRSRWLQVLLLNSRNSIGFRSRGGEWFGGQMEFLLNDWMTFCATKMVR